MKSKKAFSRRDFLATTSLLMAGSSLPLNAFAVNQPAPSDPIIDIHQHIFYHGRTDEQLLAHQRAMGVTTTIMLPAGSPVNTMSTHFGYSNGLQAHCGGNKSCYDFVQQHTDSYMFGVSEVPDLADTVKEVEKYLKMGAKIIGEIKYGVACDSPGMQELYRLAADYDVPILIHWKYEVYSFGFPRFYRMLEKHPKTKFIGHAQTWWGNIDKKQQDHPWDTYPKGPVIKGGLTDRYLSDYENMYGDLSAGSGLNALSRDESFSRGFFKRHQDKLLYGSDCADTVGKGEACTGAQMIALIRRLAPSKEVERKLLYGNARKMLKL